MKRLILLALMSLCFVVPVLADDPPPAPTDLQTQIFPDHAEVPVYFWSDVDGATDYDLAVYDDAGDVVYEASLSEGGHCVPLDRCAHQQPTPLASGHYRWNVRAHNDAGYGPASADAEFYSSPYAVPGFEPIASPTPISSAEAVNLPTPELPTNGLIDTLATAEGALATAPSVSDVDSSDFELSQNGTTIFGYTKWLLSTRSAEEIFGPWAPFILTISTVLTILLVIATAYFLFFLAVRLVRLVVWIVMTVRKLLPF